MPSGKTKKRPTAKKVEHEAKPASEEMPNPQVVKDICDNHSVAMSGQGNYTMAIPEQAVDSLVASMKEAFEDALGEARKLFVPEVERLKAEIAALKGAMTGATGDLLPAAHNVHNIGCPTKAYKYIYIADARSGIVYSVTVLDGKLVVNPAVG